MESPQQDPRVERFEQWLSDSAIEPPAGLLARIRARLEKGEDALDPVMDGLFLQDPGLSDPLMAAKVRQRMTAARPEAASPAHWFNWLAPLAAAATLAFALFSFQSKAPSLHPAAPSLAGNDLVENLTLGEDTELTRIMALAVNLEGGTDMSKLESVENLAFLFD